MKRSTLQKKVKRNGISHSKLVKRSQSIKNLHQVSSNHTHLKNAHSLNKYEQQADEAAIHLLRGEHGIAHRLTSAPAASVTVPSSRGEPLPQKLQQRLEEGFDANLSAIRIHRDAVANAAVQQENAVAFASGAHVYFATGKFDPCSVSGQKLLIHEVAHVLQQTGRRGFNGKLHATAVNGSGEIQCSINKWNDLRTVHLQASNQDENFREFIDEVIGVELDEEILLGQATPQGQRLERRVLNGQFDRGYRRRARSFLYDCLKFMNLFDGAAHLVSNDPYLQTNQIYLPFAETILQRQGGGWIAPLYDRNSHAQLATFWERLMEAWRASLLSPRGDIPRTRGLESTVRELNEQSRNPTVLVVNERVAVAFVWLLEKDTQRIESIQQERHQIADELRQQRGATEPAPTPVEIQTVLARLTQHGSEQDATGQTTQAEQAEQDRAAALAIGDETSAAQANLRIQDSRLDARYWSSVAQVAAEAVQFWNTAFLSREQFLARYRNVSILDLLRARGSAELRLRGEPTITNLRRTLERQADRFFQINSIRLPDQSPQAKREVLANRLLAPEVHAARAEEFKVALDQISETLQQRVRELFRSDPLQRDLVRINAFGLMLVWIDDFQRSLQSFPPTQQDIDQRLGHRFRISHALGFLAVHLGWWQLGNIVLSEREGRHLGHSYLILENNWEPDAHSPLTLIMSEFSSGFAPVSVGEIGENERPVPFPFTPATLVNFFQAEFLQRLLLELGTLTGELQAEFTQRPEDRTTARRRTAAQAVRDAHSLPQPQRWQVADPYFIHNEIDPTSAEVLVLTHPKTRLQYTTEWSNGLLIIPAGDWRRVFGWVIPLVPIQTNLRNLPAIQQLERNWGETPTSPREWLLKVLGLSQPENLTLLEEQFTSQAQRVTTLTGQVNQAFRDLVKYERLLLRDRLRTLLNTHSERSLDQSDHSDAVLNELFSFEAFVQPTEDRERQVAALIIGLAEQLNTAFGETERSSTIMSFYPYVEIGLRYAQNALSGGIDSFLYEFERRRLDYLHPSERSSLDRARSQLQTLLSYFQNFQRQHQREFGFASRDGVNLHSLTSNPAIAPGSEHGFIVGLPHRPAGISDRDYPEPPTQQVYYELIRVYRPFIYHPGFGPIGTSGSTQPILEDTEGNPFSEAEAQQPLISLRFATNPLVETATAPPDRVIDIPGNDVAWMNLLAAVVDTEARAIALQMIAEGYEEVFETASELAEFIPGYGQGVTAFNILRHLGEFIQRDLPTFRQMLMNDPAQFITHIIDLVNGELFSPEMLWRFLLLNTSNPLQQLETETRQRQRQTRMRRSGARTRVHRLAHAVLEIGIHLFRAFESMKSQMQGPILAAQSIIAIRPRLTFALQELPTIIVNLAELATEIDQRREALMGLIEEREDFQESILNLLEGLQNFELPGEVIPTSLAIEVLLSTFLEKLGKRGRLARRALEATGLLSRISSEIETELRNTSLDPNQLWQAELRPILQSKLEAARDEFVLVLYNAIREASIGIPGAENLLPPAPGQIPTIEIQEAPLDLQEDTLPEISPLLLNSNELLPNQLPPLELEGGESLPPDIQMDAEESLGHDLTHVRVHTGENAAQLTEATHALGLTSGSHIFLSAGTSLRAADGSKILRHELVHVIQQTGPRPLDEQQDSHPVLGQPGLGIQYDATREAEAHRIAEQSQQSTDEPVEMESYGSYGLQPVMNYRTISEMIRTLVSPSSLQGFFTALSQRDLALRVPFGGGRGSRAGLPVAQTLWDQTLAKMNQLDDNSLAGFLQTPTEVRGRITTYLQEQASNIRSGLPRLVRLSHRRPRRSRTASASATTPELNRLRFIHLLQAYIFAETGIAIQIRLSPDEQSVARIKVQFVDLRQLPIDHGLWNTAIARTNAWAQARSILGRTLSQRDRQQIHRRLQILGTDPFIWDSQAFRFSRAFLEAFTRRGPDQSANDYPAWEDYTNPDPNHPGVGLRVGTHGDFRGSSPRPSFPRTEPRQSHHIPQFLLIKYFRNQTRPNLFGVRNRYFLPGFDQRRNPNRFQAAGRMIDLNYFSSGDRGDTMPAIWLAAETHQRGKLHVPQTLNWNNQYEEEYTQASTVHDWFQQALDSPQLKQESSQSQFLSFTRDQEEVAKTDVLHAMQETYQRMYRQMRNSLEASLRREEVANYAGIVARDRTNAQGQLPNAYDPQQPSNLQRLNPILSAIDTQQQTVMSDWQPS